MTDSPKAVLKTVGPHLRLTNMSFEENGLTYITSYDSREGTVTGKRTEIIYRREQSGVLVGFYDDYWQNITDMNCNPYTKRKYCGETQHLRGLFIFLVYGQAFK
jgi:hypothetical protein